MHVCIIGGGSSGWMVATALRRVENITKISLIDSPKIPSIGVGESTTGIFHDFIERYFNIVDFIKESDAVMKYGVYYKNWGKKDYIHPFQRETIYERNNITRKEYSKLLLAKEKDVHIHDLINTKMWNFVKKNQISLDTEEHPHAWHFNAGKFILFMKNHSKDSINYIEDTVVNAEFVDGEISYLITASNKKVKADYYINCCGTNETIFKNEYIDLSEYLLCDKAIVYPLPYTDIKKQLHPYTIAKTMKNGWRWITPTWNRIGTGYVFSSHHASFEECSDELEKDIGKENLNFRLVDFHPRINKNPFKKNSYNIGMSQGFLEPLDAPGLSLTIVSINLIIDLLSSEGVKDYSYLNPYQNFNYYWWASFILSQYKHCYREDSQFWKDQKNVVCPFYNEIMDMILGDKTDYEYEMFFYTMAAKDVKVDLHQSKPIPLREKETSLRDHYDFLQTVHMSR